jgi:hypothetical protein
MFRWRFLRYDLCEALIAWRVRRGSTAVRHSVIQSICYLRLMGETISLMLGNLGKRGVECLQVAQTATFSENGIGRR